MRTSLTLRVDELGELIALVNRLHSLHDPALRSRRLVKGLCKLIGAPVGAVMSTTVHGSPPTASQATVAVVGIDGRRRAAVERHFRGGAPADPMLDRMLRRSARAGWQVVTSTRQAVIDDRTWYALPQVRAARWALDLDHCLYSVYPFGRGQAGWICFHRPWGGRPFSSRERAIVHAVHSEMQWLYAPVPKRDHRYTGELTPRQRQTLHRLLSGDGEKQAAAGLGISRHTLHVHVKQLYKLFGVHSRHELLARFVRHPPRPDRRVRRQ